MNNEKEKRMNRRELLKSGLIGAAGVAFANPLELLAESQLPTPKFKAKAKSVIQIWMWGGPSHIDTFDPKPNAGYDYCGPYDKFIGTNVDGIQLNDHLPLLAKQADKFSIIRSMTHGNNSHETASYITQTGREPGRIVNPCIGAVVSKFKGYDCGYKGVVPPYVVLTRPQGRFSEAGFLGQKYKPFATGGDPNRKPFAVEGIVAQGISDIRQYSRRDLLHNLDLFGKAMPNNETFKKLNSCEENAYEMMFGDAKKTFDLSNETDEKRDQYGRNTFGQSCLVARRLVEVGVPYVTINYGGWDTHKQHFQIMNRKLPEMDKAMATLFQDLSERGLLDSTIIWWIGEFGRGPKVQWNPPWNGGRSHYGKCFSSVVAGGGFKGGQIVGASNENGTEVAERPVHPKDVIGSIYQLMGIDPLGALPNSSGLQVQVLPESKPEQRLREIM